MSALSAVLSSDASVQSRQKTSLPSGKELFRLALPQAGLMLCHLVISMTDVWTTGRLRAEAQAVTGVVTQIFALLMLLTSLIASGCLTTVSQSLCAGLEQRANRYTGLILMLSAVTCSVVAAAALVLAPLLFMS